MAGSNLDRRVLEYWKAHKKLHPEVNGMSADQLDELIESWEFPDDLNAELRELRFVASGG